MWLKGIRGEQIRAARALVGWTQTELARKAHVSPGTIQRMESSAGQVRGMYENVWRVAECFEATASSWARPGRRGWPKELNPYRKRIICTRTQLGGN
jgi:transcriptional regulator with XRE-family HTH domain